MKEFILDLNIELDSKNAGYPKYFFDELKYSRKIRLVIGGSGYTQEVKEKNKLLALLNELSSSGKIRKVESSTVDTAEKRLRTAIVEKLKVCPKECDDHHIFALSIVSGCKNIITKDNRMAVCRNKTRAAVGHDICPDLRIIKNKSAYDDSA